MRRSQLSHAQCKAYDMIRSMAITGESEHAVSTSYLKGQGVRKPTLDVLHLAGWIQWCGVGWTANR